MSATRPGRVGFQPSSRGQVAAVDEVVAEGQVDDAVRTLRRLGYQVDVVEAAPDHLGARGLHLTKILLRDGTSGSSGARR
jgi:hypothetical protein